MRAVHQIILFALVGALPLFTIARAEQSDDHTLYYKGILHYTDLTGKGVVPPNELFILKKEILPSQGKFVETATVRDYKGQMNDLTTTVNVRGHTVFAQSADGSSMGTGTILGLQPNGDFSYLIINFVIAATGASVKNINYVTPTKLIARKEIDDSTGVPVMLWESEMDLISVSDYQSLYQSLHVTR